MKKFARILTLMLVLVTMVSLLAIPAAATSEHADQCSLAVEPRIPYPPACDCGSQFNHIGTWGGYYHFQCPNCGATDQIRIPN